MGRRRLGRVRMASVLVFLSFTCRYVHFIALQCTATHCNTLQQASWEGEDGLSLSEINLQVCFASMQYTATHCNALQHMWEHSGGRNLSDFPLAGACVYVSVCLCVCVFMYFAVLQRTATHCNT